MERQTGRIGLYLIMIVALVAGYLFLNKQVTTQSDYSLEQLEEALSGKQVQSATILQNREVPTGEVQVVTAKHHDDLKAYQGIQKVLKEPVEGNAFRIDLRKPEKMHTDPHDDDCGDQ